MTGLLPLLRGRRLPDPDAELIARFAADRDDAAFAELLRRHGPTVWGVCRRKLTDLADAEDAFQATFLVLVRRARAVRHHPAVGAWLHRTAVHTAGAVRRRNRRRPTVPMASEPPAPDVTTSPDVDELLNRLPDKYRLPVVLCHIEGLSRREAAERLGLPEGTLSARLARALGRLRGQVTAAAVPAGLAAGTARAAGVYAVSAGASASVLELIREVLHMGRWKQAAVAAAVLVGGLAVVGARQVASADDPPKPAPSPKAEAKPAKLTPPPPPEKMDDATKEFFEDTVPIAVTGTVRDADGNPIADAEVGKNGTIGWASTHGRTRYNGWTRTDKDGRYAFWFRTKPDTTVVISAMTASADGFIEQSLHFRYDEVKAHPDKPGEWDFVLAKGEVLAGVVPAAKGTRSFFLVRGPSFSKELLLGEDGAFKLWVPKGKYTLTAVLAEQRVRRDKKLADSEYSHGQVIAKAAVAKDVPSGSDKLELK